MANLLNMVPAHNTFSEELLNHGLTLHNTNNSDCNKSDDLFHMERGYLTAPLVSHFLLHIDNMLLLLLLLNIIY